MAPAVGLRRQRTQRLTRGQGIAGHVGGEEIAPMKIITRSPVDTEDPGPVNCLREEEHKERSEKCQGREWKIEILTGKVT